MMERLTTFLILTLVNWGPIKGASQETASNVVDVTQHGALGDGRTDDSQAFIKAWKVVCGDTTNAPILVIPAGSTFLLKPVKFHGPCKSPSINVQVIGNIVAPNDRNTWNGYDLERWLMFSNVDGLIVNGNGQIDGQGASWWQQPKKTRPIALAFTNCNNLQLSGLTHINSPASHMHINGCNGVIVSHLSITAPKSSPNTDGIDIGQSTNVQISDCIIGTGDDCIAIGGGSSFINISGIQCGPGHGISIGSLGGGGKTDTVEEIHVRDSSLRGTTNGARIKTWQGGSGYARKISFEGITLDAVANPIIIDQFYCTDQYVCKNQTSSVKVSDISYIGINGTSSTDEAITFKCSQSVGCSDIILTNINITSVDPGKTTRALCFNAHGTSTLSIPNVNCLMPIDQELPPMEDPPTMEDTPIMEEPPPTRLQPWIMEPTYSQGAQLLISKMLSYFISYILCLFSYLLPQLF